jgi:hypothetical protein
VELLREYGPNQLKVQNDELEFIKNGCDHDQNDIHRHPDNTDCISYHRLAFCRMAAQHESLKRKTEAINKARKTEQLQAGERLYNLESKWQQLVYNNREIETACEALQRDVKRLKGAAESTDMESS